MNVRDTKIARVIWPQHMRTQQDALVERQLRMQRAMGQSWLLARPVNRRKDRV